VHGEISSGWEAVADGTKGLLLTFNPVATVNEDIGDESIQVSTSGTQDESNSEQPVQENGTYTHTHTHRDVSHGLTNGLGIWN